MRNRSLDGLICESFYAEDISSAYEALEQIESLGELRFDLSQLDFEDIKKIREKTNKKLIFTCRGEKYSKENLLKVYENAIASGYNYIDIDYEKDGEILGDLELLLVQSSTLLILSYHNYLETPKIKDLEPIIALLFSSQADLIKIACFAKTKDDVDLLIQLQKQFANTICLAMGEFATESRVRSIKAGGLFTFTALHPEKSTAQGQINYKDFEQAFTHFRGEEKLKLAVLGNPISHSKSPEIFHRFFLENQIDGVYEKIELDQIEEFETLKSSFDGFNVTAPFKQSIISYLDDLSEAAKEIGAVNTVFTKDGVWIGDNTDYVGILKSIETEIELSSINNCLILGAGGAARAAAYAMKSRGISTTICNRSFNKAKLLAEDFSLIAEETINPLEYQLIINTIPEPFSLVDKNQLQSHQVILDAIYPVSQFLSIQKEKNFNLIGGEKWLYHQAQEAFLVFLRGVE